MRVTKLTDSNAPDVMSVFESCFGRVVRHGGKMPLDRNACMSYILRQAQLGNAFLVSGYLVVVELTVPWFSAVPLLEEKCVVRYKDDPEHDITDVPKFLLAECKRRRLRYVVAGDSLSGVMTKVYLSTPGYGMLGQTVMGDLACAGD